MVTSLLTFTLAAALIVLLPGPDTLVVLRSLARGGRGGAARTVLGVLTGLTVWVCAATLGLSALLRASETGYTVLRLAGAAYLLWIGVRSLRSRGRGEQQEVGQATRGLLGGGYLAGLATDLLNPKVGVFFVTFLPGFIPHGSSVAVFSLVLGADFVILTALYFAVILGLASRVTGWLASPTVRRRMDRATGTVLVGFGLRLAVES